MGSLVRICSLRAGVERLPLESGARSASLIPMVNGVNNIVIVGGGSAGWLTAATLAAEFKSEPGGITVTLVESDETKAIGVGEGTWPSMRSTLQKIGISVTDFKIIACSANFIA